MKPPCLAEVFEIKPEDFQPKTQVSACYLEVEADLLLLQCAASKKEAGSWGVPAGKVNPNELPDEAAKRELFEETGICIQNADLHHLTTLYIRKPDIDYVYHLFQVSLKEKPVIQLSQEHPAYLWASRNDLKTLPLMAGAGQALSVYEAILAQKRLTASVNVYLILIKEDQVLLLLRQNTGYLDGHWAFPAGHVEAGESAKEALAREAEEELGITLSIDALHVVHVMHRKTNRMNVDLFFECDQWSGELKNQEPKKCAKIDFFPLKTLPLNTMDSNAFAIDAAKKGIFYSERGFE